MSDSIEQVPPLRVAWRKHPHNPIWHAFAPGAVTSACGMTRKGGLGVSWLPADEGRACRLCLGALHRPSRPRPAPPPVEEEVQAEILSGALDGLQLTLYVVQQGPTQFRVISKVYVRRAKVTTAAEVEGKV